MNPDKRHVLLIHAGHQFISPVFRPSPLPSIDPAWFDHTYNSVQEVSEQIMSEGLEAEDVTDSSVLSTVTSV